MLPNDVKLIVNVIGQLDTDFFMAKNKSISSVENAIKKLHIQKNIHLIYKQDFYKDKQKEIFDFFIKYLSTIMEDLDHPALIKEWKQNINVAAHEKSKPRCKDTMNEEKLIVMIKLNTGQQA